MTAADLIDLRPVLWLLLTGAALAALPLTWLLRRHRQASPAQRRHALALLTAVLTFDLIVFGAYTRLSDSGLGCPDWPGCYASASPVGAHAQIGQAQQAHPTGPVTHRKAWIEMIHRYLATGVGALITVLAFWHWRAWWQQRRHRRPAGPPAPEPGPVPTDAAPGWATLCLVWVGLQGAFGALTVTMKLYPAIVTLHLLGGIGLLALLCVQAARQQPLGQPSRPARVGAPGTTCRPAVQALLLLVIAQVMLGGWVSTNYAVLACDSFPHCRAGEAWPVMDFAAGFEWRRELGRQSGGEFLPFEALTAIHMAHRLGAVLVLGVLAWLSLHLLNAPDPGQRRAGRCLAALGSAQLLTGLSNVVLDWPLPSALAHTAGAALMVALLSTWLAAQPRPQGLGRQLAAGPAARVSADTP